MDPTLFLAGISATLQAIQTWFQVRDSKQAARAFEEREVAAKNDYSVQLEGKHLEALIPQDVLDRLAERAKTCWTRYKKVLDGGFLPDEIDEATDSVRACVCRELKRISDLNGGAMPPGELEKWWIAYCGGKSKAEPIKEQAYVPVPQKRTLTQS